MLGKIIKNEKRFSLFGLVLSMLFLSCKKQGIWFSVLRDGYVNRASKAVKQLELTCTVVNWVARDMREQWQC